jgi:hypothetical protein
MSAEVFSSRDLQGPSLLDLYQHHGGKVSDKWSSYLWRYDFLFQPFRARCVNLLEIGVQNGGALEIFATYFAKAKRIIGCDINPDCARLSFDDDRIKVVIADAASLGAKEAIANLLGSERLDIIIDDGSHKASDIVRAFFLFFPFLSPPGLYVIEDVHCSYWSVGEGGLLSPLSAVTFLKYLVDVLHFEHWRLQRPRSWILRDFSQKYSLCIDDYELSKVVAIEFYNSMCVIRKGCPEEALLGRRVVCGLQALVDPDTNAERLNGSSVYDIVEESGEPFLSPVELLEKLQALEDLARRWESQALERDQELQRRESELERLRAEKAALEGMVEEKEAMLKNALVGKGAAEETITPILGELARSRQEVEGLVQKLRQLETLKEQLVGESQCVQARLAQKEEELLAAQRAKETLEQRLEEKEVELGALKKEEEALRDHLTSLQVKFNGLCKNQELLSESLQEKEKELLAMKEETSKLKEALTQAQEQTQAVTGENQALRQELGQVRQYAEDLLRQRGDLVARLSKLEDELQKNKESLLSSEKKLRQKEEELRVLRHELKKPLLLLVRSLARRFGVLSAKIPRRYLKDFAFIKRSGLFDRRYYLEEYRDVQAAGIDPLVHFVTHGWKEDRNPNPWFNTRFYLQSYQDVAQAYVNPLVHWLRWGKAEGRLPNAASVSNNRSLGYPTQEVQDDLVKAGLVFNVDILRFNKNRIFGYGFLFHKTHSIKSVRTLIRVNNSTYALPCQYGVLREDVATRYHVVNAKYSGFLISGNLPVQSIPQQFFLQIDFTHGGTFCLEIFSNVGTPLGPHPTPFDPHEMLTIAKGDTPNRFCLIIDHNLGGGQTWSGNESSKTKSSRAPSCWCFITCPL